MLNSVSILHIILLNPFLFLWPIVLLAAAFSFSNCHFLKLFQCHPKVSRRKYLEKMWRAAQAITMYDTLSNATRIRFCRIENLFLIWPTNMTFSFACIYCKLFLHVSLDFHMESSTRKKFRPISPRITAVAGTPTFLINRRVS